MMRTQFATQPRRSGIFAHACKFLICKKLTGTLGIVRMIPSPAFSRNLWLFPDGGKQEKRSRLGGPEHGHQGQESPQRPRDNFCYLMNRYTKFQRNCHRSNGFSPSEGDCIIPGSKDTTKKKRPYHLT